MRPFAGGTSPYTRPVPQPEVTPRSRVGLLIDLVRGALTLSWRRYAIADHSMEPTLTDGEWVVGVTPPGTVRIGDVVVCDLPGQPGFEITKRVALIDPNDGSLWLHGDNPSAGSVDSGTFGWMPTDSVTCRLIVRYRPWPPRFVARAPE